MRVCYWGNQGNLGYRLSKWFRAKGIETHLFILKKELLDERSRPESIDQELKSGYPSWIHIYDQSRFIFFVPKELRDYINKNFDILMTTGLLMANAFIFKIPIVCAISGSEGIWGRFSDKLESTGSLRYRIKKIITTVCYKATVRRAKKVVTGFDPVILSINSIGQISKQSFCGLPEDVIGNKKLVDKKLLKQLNDRYHNYDKVFLWLSRVNFVDKSNPSYKGPQIFLRAVERLINENHSNIRVVVGEHGFDWQLFKNKVKEKGLSQYFDFVPHLPYWKLSTYLSIGNAVVFDALTPNKSTSSGMVREALAVGAILIKSFDETMMSIAYGPDCPIINATAEEEILKKMQEILSWDEDLFRQKQSEIKKWAMEYLHWEKKIYGYINLLKEVDYTEKLVTRYKKNR